MATHYHGMTESAYSNFVLNKGKIIGPWTCSDMDGLSYLHSVQKAIDSGEAEPDNAEDYCIQQAAESAILQASLYGDSFIYVLGVTIPEDYESLDSDYSCPNMHDSADCIPSNDLKGFVGTVTEYKINPYFAPFVLAMLMQREYGNTYAAKPEIEQVAKQLEAVLHHFDSCEWFEYEFESAITLK